MSVVTNFILTCSLLEDDTSSDEEIRCVPAARLNDIIGGPYNNQFTLLNNYFGGCKVPEAFIFGLAANYLSISDMCLAMKQVEWIEPFYVKLFVQGQEEDAFHEVDWIGPELSYYFRRMAVDGCSLEEAKERTRMDLEHGSRSKEGAKLMAVNTEELNEAMDELNDGLAYAEKAFVEMRLGVTAHVPVWDTFNHHLWFDAKGGRLRIGSETEMGSPYETARRTVRLAAAKAIPRLHAALLKTTTDELTEVKQATTELYNFLEELRKTKK